MSYEVIEAKLDWVDNGHKMFSVRVRRSSDDAEWMLRTWALDELDAYKQALKRLEGAS